MPGIARAGDSVMSEDGGPGKNCPSAMETSVGEVNGSNVYVDGKLAVVEGNKVAPHNKGGCVTDESALDSFSSSVKIGGKGVGRIGDSYGPNWITSCSATVFAS